MDTQPKFKHGDLVYRIQDINSCKVAEEIPQYVVSNPHVPTDMLRVVTNEPVNFYVTIQAIPEGIAGNYHQQNLVNVYDFDHHEKYVGV